MGHVVFSFSNLVSLRHKHNPGHLFQCFCFLIFLFVCVFSQFANDDAESQKFLTNGFFGEKKLADYEDEHVSEPLESLPGSKQDLRVSDLPQSLWENNVTEIFQALISTFSVYSVPYGNKGLFFLYAIWLHKSFIKLFVLFFEKPSNPNVICNHNAFASLTYLTCISHW